MTREQLYHLFVRNNTRAGDGVTPSAAYRSKYGDMPFAISFEAYLRDVDYYKSLRLRIKKFEDFLLRLGVNCMQSSVSESRYYVYRGVKYRFSEHVYPTGSMTDDILNIVDFAADPELINDVRF